MILKVIFVQRQERYEGQYAPEAMECMTEFDYEENPEYLDDKLKEYQRNDNFVAANIVDINVNENKILDILFPSRKPIEGVI
jgi:hypothetical protein